MAFVNLLDVIYPIGSLYISFNNISPAEIIGGEWEAIVGRFPYFSDKIETGGENTHTLTLREMPNHSHYFDGSWPLVASGPEIDGMSGHWGLGNISTGRRDAGFTGDGQPHNNMPAYQSMYAWRRVA